MNTFDELLCEAEIVSRQRVWQEAERRARLGPLPEDVSRSAPLRWLAAVRRRLTGLRTAGPAADLALR